MSIIQSVALLGSAGGAGGAAAFTIDQSLRFANSGFLTRTISTGGNRQQFTFSTWIKRAALTTDQVILATGDPTGSQPFFNLQFLGGTAYTVRIVQYNGSSVDVDLRPSMLFRDPSAWYHFVLAVDTTQSTSTDRVKFYVNGNLITSYGTSTYPSSSLNTYVNQSGNTQRIGTYIHAASQDLDGYLAETHFLDGTVLDADDFAELNSDGVWVPSSTSFTAAQYGTNGFHLTYDSSQTNAGIGEDSAPIGASGHTARNDFTASGFDDGPVGIWSNNVFTTSSSSPDFTSTRQNFFSTQPQTRSFDGNSSTAGQSSGGASDGVYFFRPSTAIPNVTKIEMKPTNGSGYQYHYINGTQGTFSSGIVKQTIYSGSAITLTTVGTDWIAGNTNNGFYQLWINEVEYIDNTDNDADYLDVPTANYAVFNNLNEKINGSTAINKANLQISATANNGYIDAQSTVAASEFDCYCEATVTAVSLNGIGVGDNDAAIASGAGSYVTYRQNGAIVKYPGNTNLGTVASYTTGDVLGMTITSTQVAFYKNGSLQGTYSHSLTGHFFACAMAYNYGATSTVDMNFGQMPFIYDVPTGFKALQTNNLPEPTIKNGKDHFDVVTWSGDGTNSRNIAGLEFQPDLVWIKSTNRSLNHNLYDSVRGVTKHLTPNEAYANQTTANSLTAFNSDGFQVGIGASDNTSSPASDYVAWGWKAGDTASVTYTVKVVSDSGNKYRFDDFGTSAVTLDLEEGGTYVFDQSDSSNSGHPLRFSTTSDGTHGGGSEYTTGVTTTGTPGSAGAKTTITVASGAATLHYYCSVHSGMGGQANTNDTKGSSNFDGTIQSKVTANTSAGFSIVSYTGTNNAKTIGHGLNSTPEMIIVKNTADSANWIVFHKDINTSGSAEDWYLMLHVDDARTLAGEAWGSTAPASSVFSVGEFNNTNGLNDAMIAYCWHSVEGFSKFGSYTGIGTGTSPDADGPYIFLGFKPSFLLIKRSDSNYGGEWSIHDTTRSPQNPNRLVIAADLANRDATQGGIDFLSNGFKIRDGAGWTNQSGGAYVYMAFAESPFGGDNAPPATAR